MNESQNSKLGNYKNKVIILIVVLLLFILSFPREPKILLDKNTSDMFRYIQNPIILKLEDSEKGVFICEISNKGINLIDAKSSHEYHFDDKSSNLWFMDNTVKGPEVSEYIYNGPYCFNRNKSKAIFSLAPKKNRNVFNKFILVNWNRDELIMECNLDNSHRVRVIAWSPDSKQFAILEVSNTVYISFMSILSSCSGHPVSPVSYFLSLYDEEGNFMGKVKVAMNFIEGQAQIKW